MHTVFEWLGMTREEFFEKMHFGKCAKCGKPTIDHYATLCHGHHSAFHKWQKKKDREDKEIIDANAIGQLYAHLELQDLGRVVHKILDSNREEERYHTVEVELQRRIQLMLEE